VNVQCTLRAPIAFDGVGLHTGEDVRVEVRPAPVDTGLVFILDAAVRVPATAEYVVDTSRATVVGHNGRTVSTVEHILAALFGMGVCNAEIAVDGPEIPATDGSSKTFADAIAGVGIEDQRAPRTVLILREPFFVRDGDRALIALPADSFRVRFVADFPTPVGAQFFDGELSPALFHDEISAARTFGYLHEVKALRERGLARGGTLDNAIVFDDKGPMQPLRWPNEVVRHKVLDLLGDFALLGAWPRFDVLAVKSGHELHAVATRALRSQYLVKAWQ
jgi:UDP-3-O-[3-hydroxymyristoyl] N-acetylglucosamine deacetylase